MREKSSGTVLVLRAIAGLHVVTLAWDFLDGQEEAKEKLLGFALERSELDEQGEVIERYWLRGIKRFKLKDKGLPAGAPVPTSEHPIQSFQWGDYTAKSGVTYRYRLVPAYGKPKLLVLNEDAATTVEVTTEREESADAADGSTRHDIFFNRGVAGSQAYVREFGKQKPDRDAPASDQMKWLSRGLFEALTGFIRLAAREDAADYKLRAMLYEFQYRPVGEAFRDAAQAGADVDIRYEAQSYKEHNETMIAEAVIGDLCTAQKIREGIRHNKFIVLIHDDVPVAVWTGSTNISAGGIFGHSNVGHVIWDRDIAKLYLEYWEALSADDVTNAGLRVRNLEVEATPEVGDLPPTDRMLTLFSPRDVVDSAKSSATQEWYAHLLGSAKRIACMTFAFNFDKVFETAASGQTEALSYLLFDKAISEAQETSVRQNGNATIAVGAKLEENDLENFIGESLTGFNRNEYIHDKFLIVDPLGDDPIVVTGTANFSEASIEKNDENMLVIRGNKRVADIYFGEFMRVFDHLYSRYIIAKLKAQGTHDPDAGFLKEKTAEWLPRHFADGPKSRRRQYFVEG
jgi:phosphatidylserine/phosphatidylglycerophosphate/cardiolipin synthase-like enzyme